MAFFAFLAVFPELTLYVLVANPAQVRPAECSTPRSSYART
ncbi:MAG TPA: hypothetical protein VFQ77_03910 [Pseudonocardiaceae bacterium]|nr:hypothetical protein [Pseudonocardiaceae bacterium]